MPMDRSPTNLINVRKLKNMPLEALFYIRDLKRLPLNSGEKLSLRN